MASRAEQRAETRDRIVAAAVEAFSERGFGAASTRDIAAIAGTNQGLITYHFHSKEELWRAAMDRLFDGLTTALRQRVERAGGDDPREAAREAIRQYVRFAAEHPELMRLMVDEGKHADARTRWLVDTHLKPLYAAFTDLVRGFDAGLAGTLVPHLYYVIAGAASLMFAVAPECKRLTGVDPRKRDAVERHADFLARLLLP